MRNFCSQLAVGILFVCFLSGCSTLVPEKYVPTQIPDGADSSMKNALGYLNSVTTSLQEIQTQASEEQTTINIATLGLATLGGVHIAYNQSINGIKGTALGLGLIGGTEYLLSPTAKRTIIDNGLLALSCARKTALAMDALPGVLSGTPPSEGNSSPVAKYYLSQIKPSASFPTPTPELALRDTTPSAKMRKFADSLRGTIPPAAPGVQPSAISVGTSALATTVDVVRDAHDKAVNSTASSALAAQQNAPQYLVSTTQILAQLIIRQLHNTDPTSSGVANALQTQNSSYLSSFQQSLVSTQKELQTTQASLKAVSSVSKATTTTGTAVQPAQNDVDEHEMPPADPTPIVDKKNRRSHLVAPTAAGKADPSQQSKDTTPDTAKNAGDAASDSVQQEQNILDTLKSMLDVAAQCNQADKAQ